MSDLIERLRAYKRVDAEWLGMTDRREVLKLLPEAANEIERLRGALETIYCGSKVMGELTRTEMQILAGSAIAGEEVMKP